MHRSISIAGLAVTTLAASGCGSPFYLGQQPSVGHTQVADHMDERLRGGIGTVSVVADTGKPILWVDGDYGEILPTPGEAAREGAKEGAKAGAQAAGEMLSEDPRTVILLPILFPVAILAGTVAGAAGARIELELQEYRRGLADEILATDTDLPMPNERLAETLQARLQEVDDVSLVAANADAEIRISISEIEVITDKSDAVIRIHAEAVLAGGRDASILYGKSFEYAERDSLRNWAADDAARWRHYSENARSYLAAEIAADLFETINVRHVLRPAKTDGFSGGWSARVRSSRPTLGWELFLLGSDPDTQAIDEAATTFDLRIFDEGRLVYEAQRIHGTSHQVARALENCRALAWSVRPVYHIDGRTRAGTWMYYRSNFDKFSQNAAQSAAPGKPEFWEYYAGLRTRCAT